MSKSSDIIDLDNDLANVVVGCDPGPEYCAFAGVARVGNSLVLGGLAYVPMKDLVTGIMLARTLDVLDGMLRRPFCFVYEKMTARFGSLPGATVFDTARNSGVCLAAAAVSGARSIYAVSPVDWRVAFANRASLRDSETRAALIDFFGEDADKRLQKYASARKRELGLKQTIGCHLRDAAGVAAGAFLMKRRGAAVATRRVWGE